MLPFDMKAEIISIGTEILLGEIVDTNTQYVASRLPALGIDLYYTSVVGDNLGRLVEVIGRAWTRSDVVITTGGLGPTEDDLTREAIVQVLGEEPHVDPELERGLREFFARRGVQMPESNVKQVTLIPSARAIPNPRGTAPGWWVERDGHVIVAMPGPPTEMRRMWEAEVAPELARRQPGAVLVVRTLKTTGLGEGTVDEMVSPLLKSSNPSIGVYARADGIQLRIAAKAASVEDGRQLLGGMERARGRAPDLRRHHHRVERKNARGARPHAADRRPGGLPKVARRRRRAAAALPGRRDRNPQGEPRGQQCAQRRRRPDRARRQLICARRQLLDIMPALNKGTVARRLR